MSDLRPCPCCRGAQRTPSGTCPVCDGRGKVPAKTLPLTAALDVVLEALYWGKTVWEDSLQLASDHVDERAREMGVFASSGERLIAMLEAMKPTQRTPES